MPYSLAYRSGIASAITPPSSHGFLAGLSTYFSLGADHKLQKGAVLQDVTAVHVTIGLNQGPSVSTQIAALRSSLLANTDDDTHAQFHRVTQVRARSTAS